MSRSRFVPLLVACASLLASSPVSAQVRFHLGAGGTLPLRDYGEFARAGWLAHGGAAYSIGIPGLALGASGYFAANAHESPPQGDRTRLYGGLGFVQYTLGTGGQTTPYFLGGVGLMVHDYDSQTQPAFERSWTGLAAGAGAGLRFPVAGIAGFAQAWLLNGFLEGGSTTVAGLSVGVVFPGET